MLCFGAKGKWSEKHLHLSQTGSRPVRLWKNNRSYKIWECVLSCLFFTVNNVLTEYRFRMSHQHGSYIHWTLTLSSFHIQIFVHGPQTMNPNDSGRDMHRQTERPWLKWCKIKQKSRVEYRKIDIHKRVRTLVLFSELDKNRSDIDFKSKLFHSLIVIYP